MNPLQRILVRMRLAEQLGLFSRPAPPPKAEEPPPPVEVAAPAPKAQATPEPPKTKHHERIVVHAHVANRGDKLVAVRAHARNVEKAPPKADLPAAIEKLLSHPELKPIAGDKGRLLGRIVGLGHAQTCTRCGGTGRYSFNQMDGDRCYGCQGRGEYAPKLDADLYRALVQDVRAGKLDQYVVEVKRKAKIAAEAKRLQSTIRDAIAATGWSAYHYGPGGNDTALAKQRFSYLSHGVHDVARAVETEAERLVFNLRRLSGKEYDEALESLHERTPKLLATIEAVGEAFRRLRESGDLERAAAEHRAAEQAEDSASGDEREAWRLYNRVESGRQARTGVLLVAHILRERGINPGAMGDWDVAAAPDVEDFAKAIETAAVGRGFEARVKEVRARIPPHLVKAVDDRLRQRSDERLYRRPGGPPEAQAAPAPAPPPPAPTPFKKKPTKHEEGAAWAAAQLDAGTFQDRDHQLRREREAQWLRNEAQWKKDLVPPADIGPADYEALRAFQQMAGTKAKRAMGDADRKGQAFWEGAELEASKRIADYDQDKLDAYIAWQRGRARMEKGDQLGLFNRPANPTPSPAPTPGPRAAPVAPEVVTTSTLAAQVDLKALRSGVLLTDPTDPSVRHRYKLVRFFFTTPKGQDPIRPIETLVRTEERLERYFDPKTRAMSSRWRRRTDGMFQHLAEDGEWKRWEPHVNGQMGHRVDGTLVEHIPCDERCTAARGKKCQCSCGGTNHGAGNSIRWVDNSPALVRKLTREHEAELAKAESEAMRKAAPPWPGQAKPTPQQHATFRHPDTGEVRRGAVHAAGERGATIVDHETGEAHKVPHGHYAFEASPPAGAGSTPSSRDSDAGAGGGGPPGAGAGAGAMGSDVIPEHPHPDSHPGLSRYPEPGKAQDVRKAPEGASHKWEWTEGGKTVRAFDKGALKQQADEGFQALRGVDKALPSLRVQIERDLELGAKAKQARLAVAAKLVDQAHAGTGIAEVARKDVAVKGSRVIVGPLDRELRCPRSGAIVGHLLKQGAPEEPVLGITAAELRAYIQKHAEGTTPENLARWQATRLWAEEIDKAGPPKGDGEEQVQAAAKAVGEAFGVAAKKLLDVYVDPVVVASYRKGLTLSGTMRKAAGTPTRLTKEETRFAAFLDRVHEHDPYGLRREPDEDQDANDDQDAR